MCAGWFHGKIDFPLIEDSKGGFCNFRTADLRMPDLAAFDGLAVRVKTDGRPYLLNLRPKEHSSDDVYQAYDKAGGAAPHAVWVALGERMVSDSLARRRLHAPARQWVTLAMAARDFRLVTRGVMREDQYELELSSVSGMGVTIADGSNGPFSFEIQWMRAFEGVDTIPFYVGDPGASSSKSAATPPTPTPDASSAAAPPRS